MSASAKIATVVIAISALQSLGFIFAWLSQSAPAPVRPLDTFIAINWGEGVDVQYNWLDNDKSL